MWIYYNCDGCVNTDHLATMFVFENKSINTPSSFEVRGYFDDDSYVVIGAYCDKHKAECQLYRIIKALNDNFAKVFVTAEPYNTPPKNGSDAKKPHKLTEEEIAEVILLAKAVWGYGE